MSFFLNPPQGKCESKILGYKEINGTGKRTWITFSMVKYLRIFIKGNLIHPREIKRVRKRILKRGERRKQARTMLLLIMDEVRRPGSLFNPEFRTGFLSFYLTVTYPVTKLSFYSFYKQYSPAVNTFSF